MTTTAIETASCYLIRIADGSIVRPAEADDFSRPLHVPAGCVLVDADVLAGDPVEAVEIDQADNLSLIGRGGSFDWGRDSVTGETTDFRCLADALAAIRRTRCPARWVRGERVKLEVIGVSMAGVRVLGARSAKTIDWETLRAAATQADAELASIYGTVLAEAERRAASSREVVVVARNASGSDADRGALTWVAEVRDVAGNYRSRPTKEIAVDMGQQGSVRHAEREAADLRAILTSARFTVLAADARYMARIVR